MDPPPPPTFYKGIIYENPNMEVPVSDTEVKANAPTRLTGEPPGKTVPPACGRVGAVEIYDERCEIYGAYILDAVNGQ